MWLKEAIEKKHLQQLVKSYSRADKRFMLKNGVQTFPSYTNPTQYHVAGFVSNSYNKNGTTFIELKMSNSETLTITTPKHTNAKD